VHWERRLNRPGTRRAGFRARARVRLAARGWDYTALLTGALWLDRDAFVGLRLGPTAGLEVLASGHAEHGGASVAPIDDEESVWGCQ